MCLHYEQPAVCLSKFRFIHNECRRMGLCVLGYGYHSITIVRKIWEYVEETVHFHIQLKHIIIRFDHKVNTKTSFLNEFIFSIATVYINIKWQHIWKEKWKWIVIELFVALFVLSLCPFDISVGVGAFVIGLSQISSFFSCFTSIC